MIAASSKGLLKPTIFPKQNIQLAIMGRLFLNHMVFGGWAPLRFPMILHHAITFNHNPHADGPISQSLTTETEWFHKKNLWKICACQIGSCSAPPPKKKNGEMFNKNTWLVFFATHLKKIYAQVKLDHLPNLKGEKKQNA